jgi:hypothetical protein
MANTYNKYQLKRTSVSGRTPNTTNSSNSSFLDTAELALNLTDKKLFSSNGTALFEVGANLSSLSVAGNVSITDTFFGNNVTLSGNLTVSGTTTYINTVIFTVGDNIVTLNADLANNVAPSENSGFEVNRGSSANVQFIWDESNDRWTTNNQPMFVGGTFASGNTTVTGFANVSSFLNVVGAATVNGALVVNNTAATGNLTVTGFANVGSFLNVVGATTVNGALVVNNTAAVGNTTITGFVNVSSYGTFGGNLTAPSINTNSFGISNSSFVLNTNVSGWHYNGKLLSIAAKETSGSGLFVKPDGTRAYITGTSSDAVHQYNLSTPYDITTGVFAATFSTAAQDGTASGVFFKPDGTKMYLLGYTNDAVFQYTLATAWDVSTATYDSVSFSVLAQDTAMFDIHFSPDGTNMYTCGQTGDAVYRYTLSTPWVVSSATYVSSFSIIGYPESSSAGLALSSDGTKLYVHGYDRNVLLQYALSTPWDITTATFFDRVGLHYPDGSFMGMSLNESAGKVWFIGSSGDYVYEFDINDSSSIRLNANTFTVNGAFNVANTAYFANNVHVHNSVKVENDLAVDSTVYTGSLQATGTLTLSGSTTGVHLIGTSGTTGTLTVGGTTQTGAITVGQSTGNQAINIATGATLAANLKTINIGTGGVSGSFTNVIIGSSVSGANNQLIVYANTAAFNGNVTVSSTANVATAINVGANVNLTTASITVGNSTVNTVHNQTNIVIGNTTVNTSVSATAITSNATLAIGNTTVTGFITSTGTANVAALNVGANVNLTTSSITVGNSTVNAVHNQTNIIVGNTTVNTTVSATAITSSATLAIGNTTVTGFANVSSTLNVVGAATVNGALIVNNTAAVGNTTTTGFINVSSYGTFGGTVNATALNIGANLSVNTSTISIGNSSVNTKITSANYVFGGSDTQGIGFFDSFANYFIAMRAQSASQAGRLDATSDYNMYFQMNGGTNRGFVFRGNGNASNGAVAQIDSTGNFYALGGLYLGNTATNTTISTSLISIGNSTVNTQISAGNVFLNGSLLTVGNTTVNTSINNGTANVSTLLNVGANVNLSTTQLNVGNTTVNTVLTSTSLVVANSANVTTNGHEFVLPAATGQFKISRDGFGVTQGFNIQTSASGNFIYSNSTNSTSKSMIMDVVAGGNTTADTSFNVRIENIGRLKANSTFLTVNSAANIVGSFAVGNTVAFGNTTITGFANVSTTLNVVGAATVNGALTVNNTASVGNTTITGSANVSSTLNVVGAATVNGALTVNNTAAFGNTTITGTLGTGNTTITGNLTVTGNTTANNIRAQGSVQIDGNLTVSGNTISIGVTNLSISDNLISLNEPETATITTATSNATSFIYTANNGFFVGQIVTVTGMTPAGYNVTSNSVTFANATTFAVANTVAGPGAYVSGGTAAARVDTNPDIGFTGNYNDGTYRHAGFFRDATDGVFKVFDQYLPEPTGAFIDTSNTSFRIADFQANNTVMGSANVAGIGRVGVGSANYIQIAGAASLGAPYILANGTDTDVPLMLTSKNAGSILMKTVGGGPTQLSVSHTASAVNFLQATGGATGVGPTFSAQGSDTNVDVNVVTKGTGAVYLKTGNGTIAKFSDLAAAVTAYPSISGSQYDRVYIGAEGSATNIAIQYTTKGSSSHVFATTVAGTQQFVVAHTASAVNYVQVTGGPVGTGVTVSAQGSDSNVSMTVATKGTGSTTLFTPTSVGGTATNARDVVNMQGLAGGNNLLLRASLFRHTTGSDWTGVSYRLGHLVDVTAMSNIEFNPVGQSQGLAVNVAGNAPFQVKTSGGEQFRVADTASAVNYIQVTGGATGGSPYLLATGSDTNVNAWYGTKGAGYHSFFTNNTGSNIQFLIAHTASAVNYAQVTGAGTGSAVSYTATGTDANVFSQYRTKGTGAHDFYTNNNIQFRVADSGVTNANYVQVTGAATAGIPIIQATGSDANVNFGVSAKNTASIYFYTNNGAAQFEVSPTASAVNRLYVTGGATGVAPKIVATGSDANVAITYTTKGTGAHTFTSGGGTILALTDTASAVNYAQIYPAAAGAGPAITWTGADAAVVGVYNTKGAGAHLFYTNSNPQFRVADTASAVNYVQATGAGTGTRPSISAQGSDTNIDLALYGKGTTGGVALIASNALQMFVGAVASAVNYVRVTGAATGGTPTVQATGSDANVSLVVAGKGAGIVIADNPGYGNYFSAQHAGATTVNANHIRVIAAATGSGPRVHAFGTDTNIDLNYSSSGTGSHFFLTNASLSTQFRIADTASAVNYLSVTGSISGAAPVLSALGTNSNVGISFVGKGSGTLNLNSNTTFNANTLLFTGSNTAITLRVADNGILSFEGGAGQLFSIANNLTGQIFAVNDISGIPSLEVYSNGQVNIARYNGNVSIGTSTSTLTVNGAVSFGNAVTFSNTIAVTGAVTFSNTIIANGALTLSSTGAALTLSNTTSAFINFGAGGYAAPSVGTRSTGAKIVLFNQLSATAADYAIGVEGNHMWFGTDTLVSGYKWYANTTNIMTSNTTGLNIQSGGLSISGTSAIDSNRNGSFANVTIAGNLTVSGTTTYINTTTLNIGDNIITLNADLPGASAPTENAGIEVNRGSSANVSFIWDETNDVWASQINGVSKLTVSNTTTFVTGNTSLLLGVTSGGTEGGEIGFAGIGSEPIRVIDIDAGNNWRFNSYSSNGNITFNTNATPVSRLLIAANGNIGIGNTTPIDTLSVTGTAQVTNSTASVFLAAANGNIGLGTTVPAYPIHVIRNANTAVAEIRVENANTGSGAQSRFNMVTASAFSYALHALSDGPTPSYSIGTGPGVTGGVLISAANAALTLAANNVVSLKIFANNNIAIGANSTPAEKLRVEGTFSHTGLVPSTGTGIDQIFTATPSITLNTTWQSTGVTSTSLANGSYMVQLFANDIAAGGTANNEYYTGMMSWYSADTNSTVLDEIPLHRAGVSGSNNAIFLATQRTATANTSDLLLMISSAANNSGASTYTIKFRRMI